jgi:hypothetical protein
MIKPVKFDFNTETAVNNRFQVRSAEPAIQEKALAEFEAFIEILQKNGIDVMVIEDSPDPHTPDSVFPNNWISFHEDGTLILYPMFAENRRLERKQTVLDAIHQRFTVARTIDLTEYERQHLFLEGTGSMVLDRDNKIAYACLSPRTDKSMLEQFCNRTGFTPISFSSVDANDQPVYHTNVMMCVADKYVVICLESIKDNVEKARVSNSIMQSGKQIIDISYDQMNRFAGNMLQVNNEEGQVLLVMSSQAYRSLTEKQLKKIESFNPVIHADITTIETNGGGSARCMMAEVFLPLKTQ